MKRIQTTKAAQSILTF